MREFNQGPLEMSRSECDRNVAKTNKICCLASNSEGKVFYIVRISIRTEKNESQWGCKAEACKMVAVSIG